MYIFDDQHRFRAAMNALNIWPFYRIDPRMLCMGQYWGLIESKDKRPHNLK